MSWSYFLKKLEQMMKRKTRQGKINELIDMVFHPWFGKTKGVAEILDFIAHSVNEKKIDLRKFAEYNLYSFLKSIGKEVYRHAKRKG